MEAAWLGLMFPPAEGTAEAGDALFALMAEFAGRYANASTGAEVGAAAPDLGMPLPAPGACCRAGGRVLGRRRQLGGPGLPGGWGGAKSRRGLCPVQRHRTVPSGHRTVSAYQPIPPLIVCSTLTAT